MFRLTMIFQLFLLLSTITVIGYLLGRYMARVFSGQRTFLSFMLHPLERSCYYLFGVNENEEMDWRAYARSFVIFNLVGIAVLFLLQLVQHLLPLNPQKLPAVRWDTAFNTAVSFVTNTNWQSYVPESTMSYLTQMLGLTVQNFLSAAIGIAVVIAFIRGFVRKTTVLIGNFWVDTTRAVIYVLLPLSIILSLVYVSQGTIQNLNPYLTVHTLEGKEQTIAQGPLASQLAIKLLGTNGGGFFNANSAHPYENPTPLTDFIEITSFLIISAGLPFTFGIMLGKRKQGWAIFAVMMILYLAGVSTALWSEFHGNPLLAKLGVEHGITMEGKEVRNGILSSVVFANSTTVTSCGAVNSMHDSLMPLTGLVLLFNMFTGEVIFGGAGVGLLGMLHYAILAMFLVGLMIGRTPEIFGKKLDPSVMVMSVIALVLPSATQLVFGSFAASTAIGLAGLHNAGPHGLSEILYAFASGAGNNGSAFAGLNANTAFYNLILAIAMLVGRFATILPALAIAGILINKKTVPEAVQFPTASAIFVFVLIGTVIIVGALTFFPVLVLGPLLEQLFVLAGRTF